jgi:RNA polymerase sigma-70 factor (ECF subfamily)
MDHSTDFGRIYETHRGAIHAYFVGRTGDRWRAADLMQEVFLRVWQRLAELVSLPTEAQRAWIFTVARNLSIDEHRRDRVRSATDSALCHEPVPASPSASTTVIAAQRLAVVTEAIKDLPERQRVTLALATAGGLTSAQIATALNVPAGTVRYRLSLARHTLASALDNYDNPPDTEYP